MGWKSACNCSPSWEQMSFTKMSPNVTHSFKTRDMCICVCILLQTWSWCWQARCSSLGGRLKSKVQTTMEFYKITVTAMELQSAFKCQKSVIPALIPELTTDTIYYISPLLFVVRRKTLLSTCNRNKEAIRKLIHN